MKQRHRSLLGKNPSARFMTLGVWHLPTHYTKHRHHWFARPFTKLWPKEKKKITEALKKKNHYTQLMLNLLNRRTDLSAGTGGALSFLVMAR